MRNRWTALQCFGAGIAVLLMLAFAGPQPFLTVALFAAGGFLWFGHMPLTPKGYDPVEVVEALVEPQPPSADEQRALQLAWEEIEQIESEHGLGDGSVVPKP